VWACGCGQTDTQMRVTTIHFESSTTHAKCNKQTDVDKFKCSKALVSRCFTTTVSCRLLHVIHLLIQLSLQITTFAICYRPSVCLSSVCLSVTFVRSTQTVQIFGNISTALGTLATSDIHWKFHGDRPRGTPSPAELNARGVAKYSDFETIDGYISETVQDRR